MILIHHRESILDSEASLHMTVRSSLIAQEMKECRREDLRHPNSEWNHRGRSRSDVVVTLVDDSSVELSLRRRYEDLSYSYTCTPGRSPRLTRDGISIERCSENNLPLVTITKTTGIPVVDESHDTRKDSCECDYSLLTNDLTDHPETIVTEISPFSDRCSNWAEMKTSVHRRTNTTLAVPLSEKFQFSRLIRWRRLRQ